MYTNAMGGVFAYLGASESLAILRVALGLYWVVHGLTMIQHQKADHEHVSRMMLGLKPGNPVGKAIWGAIKQNYSTSSFMIPASMLLSGLLIVPGILTPLTATVTVIICLIILVMEPTGPGSVRHLAFLIAVGLVVAFSDAATAYSLLPL